MSINGCPLFFYAGKLTFVFLFSGLLVYFRSIYNKYKNYGIH